MRDLDVFLQKVLASQKQKTMQLDDLQAACPGRTDYSNFAEVFRKLIDEGVVQGIKTAGTDYSGLPRRFRIFAGALHRATAEKVQQGIMQETFDARLNLSWYYRQSLEQWQSDLPYIKKLSDYLKRKGLPKLTASVQQRSYEIFNDEKFLLTRGALLEHVGLNEIELAIGNDPDPLMLAVNSGTLSGALCRHLIVENKAPYYALLPYLPNSGFISLVLGYGWKIAGNFHLLPQQVGQPQSIHDYEYFGDLDYEGIAIWYTLNRNEPAIVPAVPFYRSLLDHEPSHGKENQQQNEEAVHAFLQYFSMEEQVRISAMLQSGNYYPQETLSKTELRNGWQAL